MRHLLLNFLTSLHDGRDFHQISQQMDHWFKLQCSRMLFYIKIVDNKTFHYVTLTFEISISIDNKGNKYSIDNGLYQLLNFIKQQYTNLKSSIFDADVIIAIKTSIFGTMTTHA